MYARFSILVAGYNYLEHLENVDRMLATFDEQGDVEVIFIDDCSVDGSYKIIQSMRYSSLKVIRNRKNLGLTKSLNLAAEHANGEIFVRWDVDDYFEPTRLTEIRLAHDAGFNFHVMDAFAWSRDGGILGKLKVPNSKSLARVIAFKRNPFIHGGTSFSRDLFCKHGGYDSCYRYAQDYELWTRFLRDKKLRLKRLTTKYYLLKHCKSISVANKNAQNDYFERARRKYWKGLLI